MKKNIRSLLALIAATIPLYSYAGEKLHYYDDPLVRHKHYNFKINKIPKKAEKISFENKNFNIKNIQGFVLKAVRVSNLTDVDFRDCYKSFIKKKVTSKEVSKIIDRMNKKLQDKGLILSFAYVAKHSPKDGYLDIDVINGLIRDVKVVSDVPVAKNKLFDKYVSNIIEMYPVKNHELQKNIQLINLIPGYQVKFNLEPVNDPKAKVDEVADLILIIDKKAGDLSVSANNQGIKSLGKYQYYAIGNLYNALGMNEKLTLHTGTTNKYDAMKNVTLEAEKFVNSMGTSVALLGSYIEDNPYAVLPGSADKNKSYMLRASVNHYFLLTSKYTWQAIAGYEQRQSYNHTTGSNVSTLRYNNGFLGSNFEFPDFIGGKNYAAAYYYKSLPGKTRITRFDSSAQTLDKQYQYVTLDIYRDQKLSDDFSLFTQVLSQYSSDNIPIEQAFFVGSLTSGRAYKAGTASSNRGIDFNTELRYKKILNNKIIQEVEPYVFYDIAAFNKKYSGINKSSLQSAGVGIRSRLPWNIMATAEVGVPFTKETTTNGIKQGASTKGSFILSKSLDF